MTINIKNFLNDKTKLSKMGEFQSLKQIEGLEMASISADLYQDGRDDLALFYFTKGANYATLTTTNSITSEFIPWNNNSHKKIIKGLLVNTKNANTFTGKQGKDSIDTLAKNLSRILTIKESKNQKGTSETVKVKDLILVPILVPLGPILVPPKNRYLFKEILVPFFVFWFPFGSLVVPVWFPICSFFILFLVPSLFLFSSFLVPFRFVFCSFLVPFWFLCGSFCAAVSSAVRSISAHRVAPPSRHHRPWRGRFFEVKHRIRAG